MKTKGGECWAQRREGHRTESSAPQHLRTLQIKNANELRLSSPRWAASALPCRHASRQPHEAAVVMKSSSILRTPVRLRLPPSLGDPLTLPPANVHVLFLQGSCSSAAAFGSPSPSFRSLPSPMAVRTQSSSNKGGYNSNPVLTAVVRTQIEF